MKDILKSWFDSVKEQFGGLKDRSAAFIPNLIGALIIFIVGWFVSVLIGKVVAGILKRLQFDKLFEKSNWEDAMKKANFKMSMSDFIGAVVKWILIVMFLSVAVGMLGASQFSAVLSDIIDWLPSLLTAIAIFVVAVIVSEFSEQLAKAILGRMRVGYINLVGLIVRYSIWILAGFAILSQLGVAKDMVNILMGGMVALIVLSGSIAFGLGGKDVARQILEDLRSKLKD